MVLSPLESISPHIINNLMYLLVLVWPYVVQWLLDCLVERSGQRGRNCDVGVYGAQATVAGLIFYESAVNGSPAYVRL